MRKLNEWWAEIKGQERKWLILGKGPSFQKHNDFDLTPYTTISINHAVREMKVFVASVIDLDVIPDCGNAIEQNTQFLLMPRFPHENFLPTEKKIEDYFNEFPVLRRLSETGRLIWYNLETAEKIGNVPVVKTGPYSSTVLVQLLGMMGAKSIRTLGVDGGIGHADNFNDVYGEDIPPGKVNNYDAQFFGIRKAIQKYKLDFASLTTESPIRVYIGTDESQSIAAKVLQYSILKHTNISAVFDTMPNIEVPVPKDEKNHPRTGFSFKRFAIPKLNDYMGRAIYLDSDMLVLRDLGELWNTPFNSATVLCCPSSDPLRPKQFSVLLLNCERLKWDLNEIVQRLDKGEFTYKDLMFKFCLEPSENIKATIPTYWNSLEHYSPRETALIHYTDVARQPWNYRYNPNGNLWIKYLQEALDENYISLDELRDDIRKGFVRSSLIEQLNVPKGVKFKEQLRGAFRNFRNSGNEKAVSDKHLETIDAESPEAKLLLSISGLRLNDGASLKLRAQEKLDWNYLLRSAKHHGVRPFLFLHLKESGLDSSPDVPFEQIRYKFQENTKNAILISQDLLRMLKHFEQENVTVLPLKSPALALRLYGNVALQQNDELVFLVKREDVLKATEVFISEGFEPQIPQSKAKTKILLHSDCGQMFTHYYSRLKIELRWDIAPKFYRLNFRMDEIFKRLTSVNLMNKSVNFLNGEDLLLFLCADSTLKMWRRLEWICAVAELIKQKRVDLEIASEKAKATNCEGILLLGVALARDLLDTEITERVSQQIDKDDSIKTLVQEIRKNLFESNASQNVSGSSRFHLKTKSGVKDKLRFLATRMISPTTEELATIHLPENLSFLYYVLHPFIFTKMRNKQ